MTAPHGPLDRDDRVTDPPAQRLWLVRHGETEWALLGRHTGRTDVPLTTTGRSQAMAIGARLVGPAAELHDRPFVLVLTSPRIRARDTDRKSTRLNSSHG